MTTDKEYTDMGICPNCLADGYDGIMCDNCGHVNIPEPPRGNCDYLINSEGD